MASVKPPGEESTPGSRAGCRVDSCDTENCHAPLAREGMVLAASCPYRSPGRGGLPIGRRRNSKWPRDAIQSHQGTLQDATGLETTRHIFPFPCACRLMLLGTALGVPKRTHHPPHMHGVCGAKVSTARSEALAYDCGISKQIRNALPSRPGCLEHARNEPSATAGPVLQSGQIHGRNHVWE